jgi:hypothetical protein
VAESSRSPNIVAPPISSSPAGILTSIHHMIFQLNNLEVITPIEKMLDTQESQSRGRLIVVEGLDRSGKSSQCQKLHDHLVGSGGQARYVKFPGLLVQTSGA